MSKYIEVAASNVVTFVHYYPFDEAIGLNKTEEELLTTGYLVDSIPAPENKSGMYHIMKYDHNSGTVYYEYVAKPTKPSTDVDGDTTELEVKTTRIENAVNAIISSGVNTTVDENGVLNITSGAPNVEYIASQIISGRLVYDDIVSLYPEIKEDLDILLN